ncbi:thiaminase II [Intestinibacillus massiliensis]|uniref:thiaminase II n=1 Tax=Intestinibacillus massiliensis TaxID=1871029 RepID=UPI000B35D527|nr:thiaminase II [Intestinibacillus massiliensis]
MSTVNQTTERLLDAARGVWEGYHAHPFVRGIADGSLDVEKFRFYLVQDYLYLFDYARVFAMGVVKAREPAVMRAFASYVHQILDGEMDIHKAYMERLGISRDEAERARPALANLSYTAYMRAVAEEEGPAEIAAAILSCALSYEEIAKRIVESNPAAAEHAFYGEWVRGYAAEGYAEANRKLVTLVEQLTAGYTEAQLRRLSDIFVACSRYEGMFWDMAWKMEM